MAAVNLKPLKQWYRDSAGFPKKVIAKGRYLAVRLRVRTIRAVWTALSLPALLGARLQLRSNPIAAQTKYAKLVGRNPWISGALSGLINAAIKTGNVSVALSAALKQDRLQQQNHGMVTDLWTEFLLGHPNWRLPNYELTGKSEIRLNSVEIQNAIKNLQRKPNYAESKLAVVAEQLAQAASEIIIEAPVRNLDVAIVALALGVSPVPVAPAAFEVGNSATEVDTRRRAKFQELLDAKLVQVHS